MKGWWVSTSEVERILVLGRAAPEWSKRKHDLLVCTGGITQDLEWRRLYPIGIQDLDKLHGFSWIDVRVTTEGVADPRPESRRVASEHPNYLTEISKIENHGLRKWYVEHLVRDCAEAMKSNHETIGIVKPTETSIELNEIDPKENPLTDEEQTTLSAWASHPYFDRQLAREASKKEYAKKDFELRFKFRCGEKCQHEHNMKVLDIEAFMLYRHVSDKYTDMNTIFQKMRQKLDDEFLRNDVYFALGTHSRYPFVSYMIGTLIRIKKGTKAVQPPEVIV